MTHIISVANQKGGVGKTTTAVNVAAALAIRGYRTLLVDFDMQCNTTYTFFPAAEIQAQTTLANVMIGDASRPGIEEAIYETHIENLDLAAAHIRLAVIERQVRIEEQYRLKDALTSLTEYQFIVIDCPPSLGVTLTQALLACTHVLVPIKAEFYPVEGVADLVTTIEQTKRANPQMRVAGYLVTEFDTRNDICHEALAKIRDIFGNAVFATVVRRNTRLASAPAYRRTIFEHAPDSHGASDYEALAEELLERLDVRAPLHLIQGGLQHAS